MVDQRCTSCCQIQMLSGGSMWRIDTSAENARATWPDQDDRSQLFAPRKAFRKMRVMVDAELVAPEPTWPPSAPRDLLGGLIEHELVETYRYSDGGPHQQCWLLPLNRTSAGLGSGDRGRSKAVGVDGSQNHA